MLLFDKEEQLIKGIVFNIEHYHINDGIGIRTNVFLKGCNLWCPWCCNPESQKFNPQMVIHKKMCIGCGTCQSVCPTGAVMQDDFGNRFINMSKCTLCGLCMQKCLQSAIEQYGEEKSVADVMLEVEKDSAYYSQSGGGMTLSGGEPCMQPEFARALAEACNKRYIHVSMETALAVPWATLWGVAEKVDQVLADVKFTDPEQFKTICGEPADLIKDNLRKLREKGKHVVMRCPIIPTLNDNDAHIEKLIEWAKELDIEDIDLLPFHQLGKYKYTSLGYVYTLDEFKEMDKKVVEKMRDRMAEHGLNVIVGG